MKVIAIVDLQRLAETTPQIWHDALAAGQVVDGINLELPDDFPIEMPAAMSPAPGMRGLGDVVAKITSAMGIKPCGGCKKRQEALNSIWPMGG